MNLRKYFVIFCFIILDAFLVVGFLAIRDATSINELKKEVNELTKLNVRTDRYNRKLKTSGKYAVVEDTIKDYLDSYAVGVQEMDLLMTDKQLLNVLSYDNYLDDGPEFTNSLEYLNDSKDRFNTLTNQLLLELNDEQIMNNIYSRMSDTYYINLYQDLMFDTNMTDELHESEELFLRTQLRMNNIYDTSIMVLEFLQAYNSSWVLEDNQIKFENQELCDYYNSLIEKVESKRDE